ncbi:MAG: LacI family DNA-binding transcriptional regulator [Luteolibacter sp.]
MQESEPQVTQRDIARKLGVSNATVSLALRDSSEVGLERRLEIQALAEKMGYRPNPVAAALSHQKRNLNYSEIHASIAWLNLWQEPGAAGVSKLRYFEELRHGAEACAAKFGYRLEELPLAGLSSRRIEEILLARGVNAVVLSPQNYRYDINLLNFHWEKFSIIRTGRLPAVSAHLVTADQSGNTVLAFDQILAKGYKRVGFINYDKTRGDRIWRFESGYRGVRQELPLCDQLPVCQLEPDDDLSREGLRQWMKEQRPDAIITLHPNARELLESIGYRCPEDVALASVNTMDSDVDAGIDQDPTEIGRCAVLQLLSMIYDNERGVPRRMREILVKGQWVDGATLPDRR